MMEIAEKIRDKAGLNGVVEAEEFTDADEEPIELD